jgi:arsenate reductase
VGSSARPKIYHNPRCSKSRGALALLAEHGIACEVIDYLANPPSKATLEALLDKLGVEPLAIVRTDEPEFAALRSGATRDELLELVVKHPRLLQRPIVETPERAVIGRPPERVLELFR